MLKRDLKKIERHQKWLNGKKGGRRADLSEANLSETNLSKFNLSKSNLFKADLSEANLSEANLSEARYNILDILGIKIFNISNELTLELMRWDATVCGEEKMANWANGGLCPFNGHLKRIFIFSEKRELWQPGPPRMNIYELWQTIAGEMNITI